SFSSVKELQAKVQGMPGGLLWLSTEIILKDAPNEPQTLLYQNPVECADQLFQNPSFKDCMDFAPKWVYKTNGMTRLYHEMASTGNWHAEQVHYYIVP
ncbi:hypothetical protein BS47DRAFT_1310452, partial [Hydnum rufescens UP504]